MTTRYFFRLLEDQFGIIVTDELGPINTWQTSEEATCLLVEAGIVDAQSDRMICHSGPPAKSPVVELIGATWDSEPGKATGRARILVGDKCASEQEWRLESKT